MAAVQERVKLPGCAVSLAYHPAMALQTSPLRFYGAPTDVPALAWDVVQGQLNSAGTYWVVATSGDDHPHPRPVWGVWSVLGDESLWLTLGSPTLRAEIGSNPRVTAHLDSGVEVVIVEGTAAPVTDPELLDAFVAAYDAKYDWRYDIDEYGPPLRIEPASILAWQSGGFAGRDGFQRAAKWKSE